MCERYSTWKIVVDANRLRWKFPDHWNRRPNHPAARCTFAARPISIGQPHSNYLIRPMNFGMQLCPAKVENKHIIYIYIYSGIMIHTKERSFHHDDSLHRGGGDPSLQNASFKIPQHDLHITGIKLKRKKNTIPVLLLSRVNYYR